MSQENSEFMVEMSVSFKEHRLIKKCLLILQTIMEHRQKTVAGDADFDESETLESAIKAISALDTAFASSQAFYLSPDGARSLLEGDTCSVYLTKGDA